MLQVVSKYLNDLECFVLSFCLSEKSLVLPVLQCNKTMYVRYA